jgi:hypothetical protein
VTHAEAAHGDAHARRHEGERRELWSQVAHPCIPPPLSALAIVRRG